MLTGNAADIVASLFVTRCYASCCADCHISGVLLLADREEMRCSACLMANLVASDLDAYGSIIDFTFAKNICAYCGDTGAHTEHVVPRRTGLPTWTVRACAECNLAAGGRLFPCFTEKRAHIRRRLERKWSSLLLTPEWTPDELDELTGTLRRWVGGCNSQAEWIRYRLNFDILIYATLEEQRHGKGLPSLHEHLSSQEEPPAVLLRQVPDSGLDEEQPAKARRVRQVRRHYRCVQCRRRLVKPSETRSHCSACESR